MKQITLITFRGCPNADKMRTLLTDAGMIYEDVEQDFLDASHPLRAYSSPTLLVGDDVVFGSKTDQGGSGCSVGLPSRLELLALIQQSKT